MNVKFSSEKADLFIPDGRPPSEALGRITHLGIGAHPDDLEFMALHGILECYQREDRWFGGIICTDGAGSARKGTYAAHTDEQLKAVRREEQRLAARIGQYGFVAQLAHSSDVIKDPQRRGRLVEDLGGVLEQTRPEVIYTHNPADKHASHIGVFLAVLESIRKLPKESRPARLLGCEVWRDLDWLPDAKKVILEVGGHPNLAAALNGVFDSQIAGGKRYDLAVEGRRRANATFFDSHAVDRAEQLTFAMDLTPLIEEDSKSPLDFVKGLIRSFEGEVERTFETLGCSRSS